MRLSELVSILEMIKAEGGEGDYEVVVSSPNARSSQEIDYVSAPYFFVGGKRYSYGQHLAKVAIYVKPEVWPE